MDHKVAIFGNGTAVAAVGFAHFIATANTIMQLVSLLAGTVAAITTAIYYARKIKKGD